jgi:hypothetical protein
MADSGMAMELDEIAAIQSQEASIFRCCELQHFIVGNPLIRFTGVE